MTVNCSPLDQFGISPILFEIPLGFADLPIRWYALAYIAGLMLAWRYMLRLANSSHLWTPGAARADGASPMTRDDVDELLFLATLGVILGGRLGYVAFYQLNWLWTDPLAIVRIWDGGMSFHGGMIGVGLAIAWLARSRSIPVLRIADGAAVVTPVGLFFGRIANFINGELYGRPWDGPWAMTFPCDPAHTPRHPSQLYEAGLEGLALVVILAFAAFRFRALARPGLATGIFLAGYGLFRMIVENFREPDAHLSELPLGLTMGIILSAPMVALGGFLIWRAMKASAEGAPASAA